VRFRGADHFVGTIAGCPDCGRTLAACTARPCSPRREGRPVSRLQRPMGLPALGYVSAVRTEP
jgi:hypothetical protein